MINGWKLYNNALLPTTPPHQEPNINELKRNNPWKLGCFFIRYTTDFDCRFETEWWYLIKDDKMDISNLKKKRRYEINKGIKNFEVKKISPEAYAEQIYLVYFDAFQSYTNAGKAMERDSFISSCKLHVVDKNIEYYGAFDKKSGELAGYALNEVYADYVTLTTMKFSPDYLSDNVSAALVYTLLFEYLNNQNKKYVNDGERSIRHITNFQDYLVKYFGFRKAYCKLHVEYRPFIAFIVKVLLPFRRIIKKFANNLTLNNISAMLEQEVIRKSFKY